MFETFKKKKKQIVEKKKKRKWFEGRAQPKLKQPNEMISE